MSIMSNLSLFEISWEVCNKVGGIHTVLGSKIKHAKEYANQYIVFGPYKNTEEFESKELPEEWDHLNSELQEMGITLHYGLWKTHNCEAECILVELAGYESHADEIKTKLWEHYEIDSLGTEWFDFGEVMVWSWACGVVCLKLSQLWHQNNTIVHAHEWISSGAIFYFDILKKEDSNPLIQNIRTIFTTHATMLGRAYYGNNGQLLTKELLGKKTALEVAKELNVHTKYLTEYHALRAASAATCVSKVLEKKIEELYDFEECHVTENGFEIDLSFDDCIKQFSEYHSKLTNNIQEYFKPYFSIKKNMRIGIMCGRFEIAAKGYDVTFKALGQLNEELKQQDNSKEIVILATIMAGNFDLNEQITQTAGFNIAPLSAYNIDINHPLMQLCTQNQLLNRKEDKVKVIIVPNLISKDHKVFDLDFYNIMQASDFSLNASGYEPWGYTPHESIAYGITTLTSKSAGFGAYWISNHINNSVVRSTLSENFDEKAQEIKEFIREEYHKKAATQYREKKYALEYSKALQWESLYENYKNIYEGKESKNSIK